MGLNVLDVLGGGRGPDPTVPVARLGSETTTFTQTIKIREVCHNIVVHIRFMNM